MSKYIILQNRGRSGTGHKFGCKKVSIPILMTGAMSWIIQYNRFYFSSKYEGCTFQCLYMFKKTHSIFKINVNSMNVFIIVFLLFINIFILIAQSILTFNFKLLKYLIVEFRHKLYQYSHY